ncbi:hypothetical protein ABMB67_004061, partial [Halalkalibacter oceani]
AERNGRPRVRSRHDLLKSRCERVSHNGIVASEAMVSGLVFAFGHTPEAASGVMSPSGQPVGFGGIVRRKVVPFPF